jgi:hypothetical protein
LSSEIILTLGLCTIKQHKLESHYGAELSGGTHKVVACPLLTQGLYRPDQSERERERERRSSTRKAYKSRHERPIRTKQWPSFFPIANIHGSKSTHSLDIFKENDYKYDNSGICARWNLRDHFWLWWSPELRNWKFGLLQMERRPLKIGEINHAVVKIVRKLFPNKFAWTTSWVKLTFSTF